MAILNTAILGTGNIGCDLLKKITLSPSLRCLNFVGRNVHSDGIRHAKELGISTSSNGIDIIISDIDKYDIIFDATSAVDHIKHANLLAKYKVKVINLTPADLGINCVPAVNIEASLSAKNLNLITCGGQASIPIIMAVKDTGCDMEYIEVVSSIAAKSAGSATRLNINEYLEKTEQAIKAFSNCQSAKAILNINPAIPCVNMQTTIYILSNNYNEFKITRDITKIIGTVKKYMPGYGLGGDILFEKRKITILLKMVGAGHYLPKYAGNLDIITSAAINIGEYLSINNYGEKDA